jgi:transcriptional regulator with XRE-family HTH domain
LVDAIQIAFGHVVRQLRKKAYLTQEALALEAGLQRKYISSLELGEKQASLTTIFKLSTALKVRPGELLDLVQQRLAE